jgi:hypothetical protein
LANGQSVVSGYQMAWYQIGASTPAAVFDLGKPNPDASGTIVLGLTTTMTASATTGTSYYARVAAVGASGSATSSPSNAFVFPCAYDVFPKTVTAAATGGVSSLALTTGATCAWSSTSWASWLAVDPATTTGSATIKLSIAPNATTQPRTGTVTVAGTSVSITESATPSCTFTLNTTRVLFDSSPSTAYLTMTTDRSCTWNATTSASWLSVTPTSGTGSVKLTVAAKRNTGGPRTATITICGIAVNVDQSGKAGGGRKGGG